MNVTQIGDLAQHMMLNNHTTSTKNDLNRLAEELASGRKADISAALKGDFSLLADIERQLTVMESYDIVSKDAQVFTDAAQTTLEKIQSNSSALAKSLVTASVAGLEAPLDAVVTEAGDDFDALIGALNTSVGGSSLFAGTATDRGATISAADMMAQLSAAVAGSATISDIITTVDDWFMAAGGGFETTGYVGSANDLSPFRLSETETAEFTVRADDTELRALMRDTALAALAGDAGLALNAVEKKQLVSHAGEALLTQQDDLTNLRADLGFEQARIDDAATNSAAQQTSLSMAKNDLVSSDPVEIAGQLQAVETQLEMIYTVTARLSKLSLVNYL